MISIRRRRTPRSTKALCSAAAVACAALLPGLQPTARAITWRDDIYPVPDDANSPYVILGNQTQYSPVGALSWGAQGTLAGGLASAVLISPKWVLTAGHTTASTSTRTFVLGSTSGSQDQYHSDLVFNDGFTGNLTAGNDIGLIRLDTPVATTTPASRYFTNGNDELGKTATIVGYGLAGGGLNGQVGSTYGTKRAATNVIDIFGGNSIASNYSSNIMFADFDDLNNADNLAGIPGFDTDPTPLEGAVALGDSGGGSFFTFNGRTYLSGIHSFITASLSPDGDGTPNASYSDPFGDSRVSAFNKWIDDNTVSYWTSSTSGSFTNGANWSYGTVAASDMIGIRNSGNYTITFASGATTSVYQLLSRGGNATLNLSGGTVNLTSTLYDGALVVGRYNNETASVTFLNGTVNSHDVILGQMTLVGAQLQPVGQLTIGPGATLNVTGDPSTGITGDIYVGGTFGGSGGVATLTIASNTSALNATGRLRVYIGNRVNYSGGSLSVGTIEMGVGSIGGGQIVLAAGGGKVLRTKSVSFDTIQAGKIDLADNDMIVDYDGSSPISQIRSYIQTGYANGQWNGSAITSSSANTIATFFPHKTALGFGEASSLGISSFENIPVDTTTVLVKYTYAGDANLDGVVDIRDLYKLASAYNGSGSWINGDFNYDGTVNKFDLGLLASNWQQGVGSPLGPSLESALSSLGLPDVEVPEPGAIGMLLLCSLPCLKRSRRNR